MIDEHSQNVTPKMIPVQFGNPAYYLGYEIQNTFELEMVLRRLFKVKLAITIGRGNNNEMGKLSLIMK